MTHAVAIVPAFDRADTVGATVTALRTVPDVLDVIVVDGDPSKDISVLGRRKLLKLVMQAGRQVDLSPMPDRIQQRFEKQHVYYDGLHVNTA